MNRRVRGDDGQLLPLMLGYAVVVLALVLVVVDVSRVLLYRQALAAAADGAALAAAQAADEAALLSAGVGAALPLSEASTEQAVGRYVKRADLAARFSGLQWVVATDGATATVRLGAEVDLPFGALLGRDHVQLTVSASARSPVTP